MRYTVVMAMWAVICFAASSAEPVKPEELLPGTWHGRSGSWRYYITLQGKGHVYAGKAIRWLGITDEEARRLAAGQRVQFTYANAACYVYQVAVKVDGERVDILLHGEGPLAKGKLLKSDEPLILKGHLKTPGIIVQRPLDAPRQDEGLGALRLWKEGLLAQPLPLDMERGKVHKLECLDCDDYHYTCYLPKGYDHAKATPVLIYIHSEGDAQPLSIKIAEETGWVMVGLTEARNGPYSVICENVTAAIFDLQRRFNVDMKHLYYAGFSGGARAAAYVATKFPDRCAGLIMSCASYAFDAPRTDIPIFYITGNGDRNQKEVVQAYEESRKQKRTCELINHNAGHSWADAHREEAIRWLYKVTRKGP